MSDPADTCYRLIRRRPISDPIEALGRAEGRARGSDAPPPGGPSVHTTRFGNHDLEVRCDGDEVSLALPGVLCLRGTADDLRALAAAVAAVLAADRPRVS